MVKQFQIIDQSVLEERLKSIEEGINDLRGASGKPIRSEWLTIDQFKEATGVKSHYYINKMMTVARQKGSELNSRRLGKRILIHKTEVERYFSGFFQEK